MTERISLVEAYDNRDVIAQLVRLRDDVDDLLNILKDIDPNGDLTNVVTKTGNQTIDGVKTFIGKIVADCDIIQNGSAYETHAEQVYSTKDYIVLRDGALGGLSPGDFSGLRVNKYDSVNDGHLVVDRDGVARVGDVGDEQPLLTRDETADMTSGNFVLWDGVNLKAITSSLSPSGVIQGSGNIGSDAKPVKIVDGVPVAVANNLQTELVYSVPATPAVAASGVTLSTTHQQYGKIFMISGTISSSAAISPGGTIITLNIKPKTNMRGALVDLSGGSNLICTVAAGTGVLTSTGTIVAGHYYSWTATYITDD